MFFGNFVRRQRYFMLKCTFLVCIANMWIKAIGWTGAKVKLTGKWITVAHSFA